VAQLAYGTISSILFEQSAGVLYKELIETGLVDSFGRMAGHEIYGRHSIFNFGIMKLKFIFSISGSSK